MYGLDLVGEPHRDEEVPLDVEITVGIRDREAQRIWPQHESPERLAAPEYERERLTIRSEMDAAPIPKANREAEWHVAEDAVQNRIRGSRRSYLLCDLHRLEGVARVSNTEIAILWRAVPRVRRRVIPFVRSYRSGVRPL